jgi:3-hydroxyacyl-[acyl-carrier-protein] dehydratase
MTLKLPMDQTAIKTIIPHRDPFLLVDRITELDAHRVVGWKLVRPEEPYLAGHFPGNPIMPGVLMLEALAQTMGVMVLVRPEHRGKLGYFASMNNVRFRELVRPGDELRMEVTYIKEKTKFYIAQGRATVNDKLACEAELMLFMAQ